MTEQRRSYAGECVYVGVDVHKETYTVTCVCHKQIVKTATVQAEPASLAASLRRWFPGATLASAYEAGFSAFVLHRALTKAGISNIVVNPASLAVAANDKVKTDRRDSKRLAVDLADGRLRGIYVPTEYLLKKRSGPASCRAPARSWSSTAPHWRARAKPHCINLA